MRRASRATYGKFVGEPFERGFGTTVGNALRRVLLSSLQGAAITGLKIEGVLHEFATLPGVREDVTDIVLNLKEVRLKLHDGLTAHATHREEGRGRGPRRRHPGRPEPRGAQPRACRSPRCPRKARCAPS